MSLHCWCPRKTDLVRLVQELHPLLEDLAVVLSTLPQHLPPQLLHRRSQLIPLELIQRLAILYHLEEGDRYQTK